MVQLETGFPNHFRSLVIVTCIGKQQTEEYVKLPPFFEMSVGMLRSAVLGFDITRKEVTIGMALPIWANLDIALDGDG